MAFNLQRGGRTLPYEMVEIAARDGASRSAAAASAIPGRPSTHLVIPPRRTRTCLRGAFSIGGFRTCLGGPPVGALRASVGVPTNDADLDRLTAFAVALTSSGFQHAVVQVLTCVRVAGSRTEVLRYTLTQHALPDWRTLVIAAVLAGRLPKLSFECATESGFGFVSDVGGDVRKAARRLLERACAAS